MNNLLRTLFLLVVLATALLYGRAVGVWAEEASDAVETESNPGVEKELEEQKQKIRELEAKLKEVQGQKQTVAQAVSYLTTRINLTESQIAGTQTEIKVLEREIDELTGKIETLNVSLDKLTQLLVNRINASYKNGLTQPFTLLVSSDGFGKFFKKYKYLKASQYHDREVILALEKARTNYDNQKTLKESKQQEMAKLQQRLNQQKVALSEQQAGKQKVLEATQNDEKRYQVLLSQARAEYDAIQSVLIGQGQETRVREVKEGEVIASIISGSSCNSSGSHLHFTITKDNRVQNPFSYLRSIDHINCSGSSCGSGDADTFNPSGSWRWPIDGSVRMTQGYGTTWAVRNTWVGQIYNYHNGLDMISTSGSLRLYAVRDGVLYRGSYTGSGGCQLRYVRVDHSKGVKSYYLHVNY